MKKIAILLGLAWLGLFSCSKDDIVGPLPPQSGAVEIKINGKYTPVHNETLTMPGDKDEMIIEFRSHFGVWSDQNESIVRSSSGNISVSLIDPLSKANPARPNDSTYKHLDHNGNIVYEYFFLQKLKVTAPGENPKSRMVKFRINSFWGGGDSYSDFTVIKPGKE